MEEKKKLINVLKKKIKKKKNKKKIKKNLKIKYNFFVNLIKKNKLKSKLTR